MTSENAVQQPPDDLADSGRRLWLSIATDYELENHELAILHSACRIVDILDRLAGEAAVSPTTTTNQRGDSIAHPALVESRQQSIALSRLLAALRIPSGEEEGRPQRRGGARGHYSRRAELRAIRGQSS